MRSLSGADFCRVVCALGWAGPSSSRRNAGGTAAPRRERSLCCMWPCARGGEAARRGNSHQRERGRMDG